MAVPTEGEAAFRSPYASLWIDRTDWEEVLAGKLARGALDSRLAEDLRFFRQQGYVVLGGAVDHAVIDELVRDIDAAYGSRDPRFLVQTHHGGYIPLPQAERNQPSNKLLDVYVHSDAGRRVAFAPRIGAFLEALFEEPPLAFQNLTFEVGSTQAVHQDTAYVVVDRPLAFAASWVALEDIREGSGELVYYPGSHELPDFEYAPGRKYWKANADGPEIHDRHLAWLHAEANRRGMELTAFRPRRGDALIWHAGLAHGGGPITAEGVTRRSYVTHYCPISARPHYYGYLPQRARSEPVRGGHVSSSHYDLA